MPPMHIDQQADHRPGLEPIGFRGLRRPIPGGALKRSGFELLSKPEGRQLQETHSKADCKACVAPQMLLCGLHSGQHSPG
jgi:hypothetical protein